MSPANDQLHDVAGKAFIFQICFEKQKPEILSNAEGVDLVHIRLDSRYSDYMPSMLQ